jgi:hypothetical protein
MSPALMGAEISSPLGGGKGGGCSADAATLLDDTVGMMPIKACCFMGGSKHHTIDCSMNGMLQQLSSMHRHWHFYPMKVLSNLFTPSRL